MDLLQLVDNMTEEMYLRLKCAAETGKWPEGTVVDQGQKESALQITLAYQARRLNSDEIMTVGANGELVTKTKRELKQTFTNKNDIARFSDL
ncbi:DUF1315 family protein [Colwelliaceae bacterium 6471]